MSEITRGVMGMPYEMAMGSELSRRQFYSIAREVYAENESLRKDAERYRKLRTVTPYRFKKMQDASITDGGDVLYFHSDRFDTAIDDISSPENP